jgi:hypothetical protein
MNREESDISFTSEIVRSETTLVMRVHVDRMSKNDKDCRPGASRRRTKHRSATMHGTPNAAVPVSMQPARIIEAKEFVPPLKIRQLFNISFKAFLPQNLNFRLRRFRTTTDKVDSRASAFNVRNPWTARMQCISIELWWRGLYREHCCRSTKDAGSEDVHHQASHSNGASKNGLDYIKMGYLLQYLNDFSSSNSRHSVVVRLTFTVGR